MQVPPLVPGAETTPEKAARPEALAAADGRPPSILACVDASPLSRKTVAPSVAIARALGGELTVMRVLEPRSGPATPPDPVAWDLRRRQASDLVEELARESADDVETHPCVLEGRAADAIAAWAQDRRVDLTCLCTHGEGGYDEMDLGGTARRLVLHAASSILLVPAAYEPAEPARFTRIAVALDGSPRAEAALPLALRIADAEGAEVILVHAVPEPPLTGFGPLEPQDLELRERLLQRNQRVAREYLSRVRAHIAAAGVPIRALVLGGSDVRQTIAHAIADEAADLVVLASHGRSGLRDVALGGVPGYLAARSPAPLLIVRSQTPPAGHPDRRQAGARLPARAVQ